MADINRLLEQNRAWAASTLEQDGQFFERLAKGQNPHYLWIGCADSRVTANKITGLDQGDLFVHRNVANLVVPGDLNCLAVIQYAVEVLGVADIIVCGHYGCGGVKAACDDQQYGLIDEWLRPIEELYARKKSKLASLSGPEARGDMMCEFNVSAQVANVCHTQFIQQAWSQGKPLRVHGWIYALRDGLLRPLQDPVESTQSLEILQRELDA